MLCVLCDTALFFCNAKDAMDRNDRKEIPLFV